MYICWLLASHSDTRLVRCVKKSLVITIFPPIVGFGIVCLFINFTRTFVNSQNMITLKDLAATLGVSVSTVSKALKDSPEISKDTIARVKEIAQELNYRPNTLA